MSTITSSKKDLGVLLVASTINKCLKKYTGDFSDHKATIHFRSFLQELQTVISTYSVKFSKERSPEYGISKEDLVAVITGPKFSFVQLDHDNMVIDAAPQEFEEKLKKIVVDATLSYSQTLIDQINEISQQSRPTVGQKFPAEDKNGASEETKEIEAEEVEEDEEAKDVKEEEAEDNDVEMQDADAKEEEEKEVEADIKEEAEVEKEAEVEEEEEKEEEEKLDDNGDEIEADASSIEDITKDATPELDSKPEEIPEKEDKETEENDDEENADDVPAEEAETSQTEIQNDELKASEDAVSEEKPELASDEAKKDVEGEEEEAEIEEGKDEKEPEDEAEEEEPEVENTATEAPGLLEEPKEELVDTSNTVPVEETESPHEESPQEEDVKEEKTQVTENTESTPTIEEPKEVKVEIEPSMEPQIKTRSAKSTPEPSNSRKRSKSPYSSTSSQHKRFQNIAVNLVNSIQAHRFSSPFLQAVNKRDAADYYDVIYEPKNLKSILKTVKSKVEPPEYQSIKQLERDIMLMFANCIMYNKSDEDLVELTLSMKNEVHNIFKMFEEAESDIK